jgi:HTH-type transcriptional regulator/antitoxin HipB
MSMAYDIKVRLHRHFIENVRARRLELGLTQTEVAAKMGISQSSYAEIESGRRTPTLEAVEKVAKAMKVDAIELLSEPSLTTG